METYTGRYRALCGIIDDLPSHSSSEVNRFHIGDTDRISDIRSFKLDHFLSTARSRKGKEVDRSAQVEQLRLSERDFDNLGQIGDGQFGSVSAVRCTLDGQVYAMKSIKKYTAMRSSSQMNLPLERHIHILASNKSSHPAPQMITAFQSDTTLHLITTYAAHGSLWDRMCGLGSDQGETSQAGRMAEDEVRWWASQMVESIEWLHDQGFVHRDIKPHNFLIHSPTHLSLTDFGSAAALIHPVSGTGSQPYINKHQCLMPIGTPDYIAPEVLKMAEDAMLDEFEITTSDLDPDKTVRPGDLDVDGSRGYGASVDWWSFGATVYEMATGEAPFYARTVRETYELIMRCGEGTYRTVTSGMSKDLASLCLSLLTSSEKRLGRDSAKQVSNHPFFAKAHQDKVHPPTSVLSLPVIELGDRNDQSDTEMTFDHHFQSSVGMTTTLTTSCSSNNTNPLEPVPDRWCGWTYIPPPSTFAPSPSSPVLAKSFSDRPMRPLPRHVQNPPVTPARSTASMPLPLPMTTPRSTVRKRPVSDQRAMAQLVKCVQYSARKRASSVKPRPSSGRVGKDAWTPTPKPRPPLMERTNSLQSQIETGANISVDALSERQVRLEKGLIGLEQRFARLKSRLQAP